MVNANLAPSFSVADPTRNWYEVTGTDDPVVRTPREIISAAQTVAGVTADGNWGTGTSTALIAKARQMNFNSKYIAALEKVKNDRRLNLDAFRTAIAIAYGIQPQRIVFGANESQVQLPAYGAVAPGAATTATTPARTTTTPARTSTPARTTTTPPASLTTRSSTFGLSRNAMIGIGVGVAVTAGVVGYLVWKDTRPKPFGATQKRPTPLPATQRLAARRPPPRRR